MRGRPNTGKPLPSGMLSPSHCHRNSRSTINVHADVTPNAGNQSQSNAQQNGDQEKIIWKGRPVELIMLIVRNAHFGLRSNRPQSIAWVLILVENNSRTAVLSLWARKPCVPAISALP